MLKGYESGPLPMKYEGGSSYMRRHAVECLFDRLLHSSLLGDLDFHVSNQQVQPFLSDVLDLITCFVAPEERILKQQILVLERS